MRTFFILLMLGLLGYAIYISLDSFVVNQGAQSEPSQVQETRARYEEEYGEIDVDLPRTYQDGVLDIGGDIKNSLQKLKPSE